VIETFELLLLLPIPSPSEVFLLKIGMSEVRRPLTTGLGDFELWQLLQVSDELDFRLLGAESFLPSDDALLLLAWSEMEALLLLAWSEMEARLLLTMSELVWPFPLLMPMLRRRASAARRVISGSFSMFTM
jgi:hypothetical protein